MYLDIVDLLKKRSENRCPYFYNIMPIVNIPSVLRNGILSYNNTRDLKHSSVALDTVQERRELVKIPNGGPLHSYANLYFTYNNPMMYRRRNEAEKLCVLVINPNVLYVEGCILSDQNAATDLVRFYTPEEGLDNLDFDLICAQYWTDENLYRQKLKKAVKCAEILVPERIDCNYILGAYVVNDEVKCELEQMKFDKKIVVEPSVFYRR